MKHKLFENVSGNQFKLITESIIEDNPKAVLVREGLKKVFSAGDKILSYKRLQGVGLGYIKSVEEARKTAITEARGIATTCGYIDDPYNQVFIKEASTGEWNQESSHDEPDMSNPEENREVKIAKGILQSAATVRKMLPKNTHPTIDSELQTIELYVNELINMHKNK